MYRRKLSPVISTLCLDVSRVTKGRYQIMILLLLLYWGMILTGYLARTRNRDKEIKLTFIGPLFFGTVNVLVL